MKSWTYLCIAVLLPCAVETANAQTPPLSKNESPPSSTKLIEATREYQAATHNRLGWDHRNAVDVGLHPDSAEGRMLISFLQTQDIPFLAFRGPIPGVSTGAHIHIGRPSHRLS